MTAFVAAVIGPPSCCASDASAATASTDGSADRSSRGSRFSNSRRGRSDDGGLGSALEVTNSNACRTAFAIAVRVELEKSKRGGGVTLNLMSATPRSAFNNLVV